MTATQFEQKIKAAAAENAELRERLVQLEQQLSWFKRQLFGRKSERLQDIDPAVQPSLLADLAGTPESLSAAPLETVSYQRRKTKTRDGAVNDKGLRFDDSVPVQVIEVPVPELSGPDADAYEVVDVKRTLRLAQRPGSYLVLEYRHPVIKHRETRALKSVPAPANVLEKSMADVSFLAGMLVDKFQFHLPLYRQHQRLQQSGIQLSRMTLTQLCARAAQLLMPIHAAQLEHILLGRVVAMDETPIKAGRKSKGKMRQAYFWPVFGEAAEVSFTYSSTRGAAHVKTVLGEQFRGVLLSDGYVAYEKYAASRPEVTHAQCWAHTRREFERALEAEPQAAGDGLRLIAAIYQDERWIREKNLEGPEKLKARTDHCEPKVRAFWRWCHEQCQRLDLTPSNPLSKALKYALGRVESLEVFLGDPDVPIDTNHLERALRPIPMGRKNWNFCWTEVGAEYVGIIQSLVVTCRLHDVNPFTYLVDVLQRVSQHPASRVDELTPRRWKELFAAEPLRSDVERHPGSA